MAMEIQAASSGASERWELRIGATVYTTDEVLGKLRQVVISPGTQRVVALIVHDSLLPKDYLVPIEVVRNADEDEIQLSWSMEQAQEQGRYEAQAFHTYERSLAGYAPGKASVSLQGGPRGRVAEEGAGPAAGMPLLRVGMQVVALDGDVGRVSRVLVNAADGGVTHIVVHQGLLVHRDRLIPAGWVSSVTTEVVTLAATRAEVSALPEYHRDDELADNILDAWMQDDTLNALLTVSDVRVTVHDGIALLEGYVETSEQRQRLESLAWSVNGVLGVRNEVVADDALEQTVAHALAEDPRTRGQNIQVKSYLGNVHLAGVVPDQATCEAAEAVATQVLQVKAVINVLVVADKECASGTQTAR